MSQNLIPPLAAAVSPLQRMLDQLSRSLAAPWAGPRNQPGRPTPITDPEAFTPLDENGNRIPTPGTVPNPTPSDYIRSTWDSPSAQFTPKPGSDDVEMGPYLKPWIADSVRYGKETGIDPRLVMAIVLGEGDHRYDGWSGKVWPSLVDYGRWASSPVRPWLSDTNGNSLGLTNMKEEAFNSLKKQYPTEFARHEWSDLMTSEHLAIKAAAYRLKQIKESPTMADVPLSLKEKITLNEYLAAGYNAGDKNLENYRNAGDLGPEGAAYAQRANTYFLQAQDLMDKMYIRRADGGDVRGPGSSIGDKIPAWLSDGEFVMNARSTAVNRPFLQALNADPYFLHKTLAARSQGAQSGGGVQFASSGQPTTVNISMASNEDIVSRLKVLSAQWELMHAE
ncbi:hypothetical protein [Nocardia salmonicida]|uniref:hypothetical protein n=1 Tax=Nocardia salmonicida TaxID=53431 RepID=UPI0037949D91